MKDLLLEIRAKQNEISEIMGTAITVGDLSDEKSDDIRKDAKRDALNDIKSGLTKDQLDDFKKSTRLRNSTFFYWNSGRGQGPGGPRGPSSGPFTLRARRAQRAPGAPEKIFLYL